MARTLNSYAYEIWELVRKKIVDDDEIDLRLIKDLIKDQRELAVSNAINKGGAGTPTHEYASGSGYDGGWDQYVQSMTLTFNPVICPPEDYPCIDESDLWKSNEEFPTTLTLGRRPAVIRVMPCPGEDCAKKSRILFASHDRARFVGNGRFNTHQIIAYIRNDHMWFMTKDTTLGAGPINICIDAIFSDPTDVPGHDDELDKYPIGKQWPYMMGMIMKFLQEKLKSTQDRLNDATNE